MHINIIHKKIGKGAFTNCVNLKNIIIPETVEILDDYCFLNCGLTNIKNHPFYTP